MGGEERKCGRGEEGEEGKILFVAKQNKQQPRGEGVSNKKQQALKNHDACCPDFLVAGRWQVGLFTGTQGEGCSSSTYRGQKDEGVATLNLLQLKIEVV